MKLGLMYEMGVGTPKNEFKAYIYYLVAVVSMPEDASLKKFIQDIEKKLTPQQRIEAQREANNLWNTIKSQ